MSKSSMETETWQTIKPIRHSVGQVVCLEYTWSQGRYSEISDISLARDMRLPPDKCAPRESGDADSETDIDGNRNVVQCSDPPESRLQSKLYQVCDDVFVAMISLLRSLVSVAV